MFKTDKAIDLFRIAISCMPLYLIARHSSSSYTPGMQNVDTIGANKGNPADTSPL